MIMAYSSYPALERVQGQGHRRYSWRDQTSVSEISMMVSDIHYLINCIFYKEKLSIQLPRHIN